MQEINAQEAVDLANKYLMNEHPGGSTLRALLDGAWQRGSAWHVPIQPDKEPIRRYEYYESLANVETDIEDETGVTIVFEPVLSVEDEQAEFVIAPPLQSRT